MLDIMYEVPMNPEAKKQLRIGKTMVATRLAAMELAADQRRIA
jgi:hypothetical protein